MNQQKEINEQQDLQLPEFQSINESLFIHALTCLLITGPRSASGTNPEFTFSDFAHSTSFFSLQGFEKHQCHSIVFFFFLQ